MTATYFEIPAQAVFPGGLALVALAITLILLLVYRRYPKRHLLLWIGATAALTALHGFVVLGTVSRGLAERALIEQLPIALAVLAAWLRGGLIAAGAYELTRRRTVHLRRLTVLGPLWGIALLTAVLIPAFGGTRSLALVTVAGALLAAVGFTIAGWLLVSRRGEQRGVATLLFGILFLFYGAAALVHAGVVSAAAVHGLPAPFPRETALLEILFQIVIGLGMMSLILEDERDAAVLAASQVEHIAYHDSLTGLPNRSRFMDRLTDALERARRHRYKLAVLFLDLDRFKQINDSLGHTMGDLLLKAVAGRLRGALRQDDMVARFGGDEFAVLIHIIGRIDDAAGVAQKVLDVLEPPIPLGDREIVMATSIGITIFPTDGVDGEALVKNADTAMYRAKAHGGSTFQFYAPSMSSGALELLDLEHGLRKALNNDELVLYYQPLIDLRNGEVYGLEALLRWNHPALGVLLPERFIPVAEVTGLIIPIGRRVLLDACSQAKLWQVTKGRQLVVGVNLSPRQFHQADLVDQVREALQESELDPDCLEIEITESSAMVDVAQTISILRELKELGVRIAIDDFGTGYSSLSYLKDFPVDTVKLDQSFVRDLVTPHDAQIVRGVISMAHEMNLQVMAEGVETLGQLDCLRVLACDRLQGFLFSRPLPAEEFEQFLRHHRDFTRIAS